MTARRRASLTLLACLWLSACASGSIRDGIFVDPDDRFAVRVPPAPWASVPLDGAALAFRAPDLDAGIVLRADCSHSESGPLPAVARHLFFGLSHKQTVSTDQLTRAGASGVRTRLRARLDGRPVEVEAVTLRRGPCLYDFAYVAPPEHFEAGRREFDAFVGSWAPLPSP